MAFGFIIYFTCLFNGTTDEIYNRNLENRNKRKYSKVSASGFHNKGLHLRNGKLDDVQQQHVEDGEQSGKQLNGNCDGVGADVEILTLESLPRTSQNVDMDVHEKPGESTKSLRDVDDKRHVKTETIEKTLEFDDNDGEIGHENKDYPDAVDANDSVISRAYSRHTEADNKSKN